MTETKKQWIEREARRARARYWGSIGDWDDDGESIRQDWRNVVAPYYPEPLRVPVARDEMAQIVYKAGWCQSYVWDDNDGGSERKQIYAEADAILDAINRRECVALTPNERAELENLRAECKRMRTQRAEEKIGCHGCGVTLPKTALEIGYNPVVDGVRVAVCQRCWDAGVGLQGKARPETRPVKVRFDVTDFTAATQLDRKSPYCWHSAMVREAMDYLADHAVTDVPPGIQRREWTNADVEELAKVMRVEYANYLQCKDTESIALDSFMCEARAALAWFDGKRGEV